MLRFHSPGIPIPAKSKGILAGLDYLAKNNLDGMEVLFTRGVRMRSELAAQVNKKAKDLGLTLTVHGPYWINFNSKDSSKFEASIERVVNTAIKAHELGAKSLTFHPAFMHDMPQEQVLKNIVKGMEQVFKRLEVLQIHDVLISPETTGKPTQYGSVSQILAISKGLNHKTKICVDFSHFYARTNGKENGRSSFENTLDEIHQTLGEQALKNLHIHISGILYSEKGERKHRILLEESQFEWKTLLKVLKERDVSGWVSIETPDIEKSTKVAKDYYQSI